MVIKDDVHTVSLFNRIVSGFRDFSKNLQDLAPKSAKTHSSDGNKGPSLFSRLAKKSKAAFGLLRKLNFSKASMEGFRRPLRDRAVSHKNGGIKPLSQNEEAGPSLDPEVKLDEPVKTPSPSNALSQEKPPPPADVPEAVTSPETSSVDEPQSPEAELDKSVETLSQSDVALQEKSAADVSKEVALPKTDSAAQLDELLQMLKPLEPGLGHEHPSMALKVVKESVPGSKAGSLEGVSLEEALNYQPVQENTLKAPELNFDIPPKSEDLPPR